jgi:hypothetical protein
VEEITEDAELVACVRVPGEDKPGLLQEVRTFATTTATLLELRGSLVCAPSTPSWATASRSCSR